MFPAAKPGASPGEEGDLRGMPENAARTDGRQRDGDRPIPIPNQLPDAEKRQSRAYGKPENPASPRPREHRESPAGEDGKYSRKPEQPDFPPSLH